MCGFSGSHIPVNGPSSVSDLLEPLGVEYVGEAVTGKSVSPQQEVEDRVNV